MIDHIDDCRCSECMRRRRHMVLLYARFDTIPRISHELGLPKRVVQSDIDALVARGLVQLVGRFWPTGASGRPANVYDLTEAGRDAAREVSHRRREARHG